MAKALLECETLDAEQIDDIMSGQAAAAAEAERRLAERAVEPPGGDARSRCATALQRRRWLQLSRAGSELDLEQSAGHGRGQRHARFLFRRRPLLRCRRPPSRTRAAWPKKAPTSSISAASLHAPVPLRCPCRRSWTGSCRCWKGSRASTNRVSVDTRRPEVMQAALGAGASMINDIEALAGARRARSRGEKPMRRLPHAQEGRAGDDAAGAALR